MLLLALIEIGCWLLTVTAHQRGLSSHYSIENAIWTSRCLKKICLLILKSLRSSWKQQLKNVLKAQDEQVTLVLGDLEQMSDRVRLTQQMAQDVPGGVAVHVRES